MLPPGSTAGVFRARKERAVRARFSLSVIVNNAKGPLGISNP
jgi:hypothetical protein